VALGGCRVACFGVLHDFRSIHRSTRTRPGLARCWRLRLTFARFALVVAAVSFAACNRPETPPTPVVPVQPLQPQAATPESAPLPVPPPKEAPSNAQPDAPDSPATAPAPKPEKPADPQATLDKPSAADPPASAQPAVAKKSKGAKNPREIHLNPGNTGCIEMYGTCTPPPDQLCTSSAFYLDCNKTGQLPSTGEWLHCVCN
jgi:hypothetical protein